MNSQLRKLRNIVSENCVTIILNTHRTRPENEQDPILLKNLIKEAQNILGENNDKREAEKLTKKINSLASEIDHNYNQESLILFVNENVAQYIRLPIAVKNRVVIDHTFATRDLVRALNMERHYFILVLSQQKARLLEAFNDRLIEEIQNDVFPVENKYLQPSSKAEEANARRQTNLISEFFNQIDKEVKNIRKENPLSVLICTEESNYHEYMKVADQEEHIYDTLLNGNRLGDKAENIINDAWKIVNEQVRQKNNARKDELLEAVNQNRFLSDPAEIWTAIKQGRVQTLFIEKGKFQAAVKENDMTIKLVNDDSRGNNDVIDDIYDEMIEANMDFGGDVVFMPEGELKEFNGFGAIIRFNI